MSPDNTLYKPMRKQSDAGGMPRAALGMLNLPNANRSTSSLFDAVLGGDGENRPSFGNNLGTSSAGHGTAMTSTQAQQPVPVRAAPLPYAPSRSNAPGVSPLNAGRPVRRRSVRDPRRSGQPGEPRRGSNSNTEITDSWDRMSDADSAKLKDGDLEEEEVDEEKMQELERVVNKRKSVLPALESELAALNARIREAEERLARASAGNAPAA